MSNLREAFCRSVRLESYDIDGTAFRSSRVVAMSPDREVRNAIAVNVAERCHTQSEHTVRAQWRTTVIIAGDFHGLFNRTIEILENHISSALWSTRLYVSSVRGIGHYEVLNPVLVEVTNWCDTKAQKCQRPVFGRLVDLLTKRDRASDGKRKRDSVLDRETIIFNLTIRSKPR